MRSSRRRSVRAARTVVSGSPSSWVQRSRLCASAASTVQAPLAWKWPDGKCCKRLVFEVGDDLLDDGVVAVLGLDERDVLGAVGDEREVPPVGEQLGLRADQPGAAHDQPPLAVDGLGDLRLAAVGVGDRLPGVLGDRLDGSA